MASAEDYAAWIVQNADKKGTPEFDIVVKAYQDARGAAPTAPQGSKNNDIASQLGLGLRATIKAGATLPAMLADAVGGVANKVQDVTLGDGKGYRFQQQMPLLDRALTQIGLPQPDTPLQRIVSQGVETGVGALSGASLANQASKAATGATQEMLKRLAADPAIQTVSGTAAGLAGQQSAESGNGFGRQLVSSLAAGLGGSMLARPAMSAAFATDNVLTGKTSVAGMLRDLITPKTTPADLEKRITIALQRQGIDPASITPALKRALMDDVGTALKTGGSLDEGALARLADYRRLGLTPTRGRLTLDPYDVTQEQNAMRVAAATGAKDARLPQIAQDNNQRLLGAVEGFKPTNDAFGAGQKAMGPIWSRNDALEAEKRALYQQANQMTGGDVPLERGVLNGVWAELDKARKIRFLPEEVGSTINDILSDTRAPFTVNVLDELKTTIATAMRGTNDGNKKAALSIVRNYLDNANLVPDKKVFGGNQVVSGAQGQAMAAADQGPGALLNALNEARAANRSWRQWQESTPGVTAAVEGANPDNWIRNNILSRTAGVNDVERLASEIGNNPAARDAVRGTIVQQLKDAAIGKGNQTQTANFSGRQWLRALDDIGDRKLRLFFSADELEQLKAIGRTGSIETFQPRGSAVANSNTPAGLASLAQGVGKYLTPFANKLPFGQAMLSAPIDNITLSLMERGATNVPRGLLTTPPTKPSNPLDALLLPGLLSVSP